MKRSKLQTVLDTVSWAGEYHTLADSCANRDFNKPDEDRFDTPLTTALLEAKSILLDILDMEELQDE